MYIRVLGDCFSGTIADDYLRQIELLDLFVGAASNEFVELEIQTETRIPIVRFLHESTNFRCDLSFRSGLGVLNSKLVKYDNKLILVHYRLFL